MTNKMSPETLTIRAIAETMNPTMTKNQTLMTHAEDEILGKEFQETDQTNQNYLIHYGVLGMKWGVRKQRPRSSNRVSSGMKKVKNVLSGARASYKKQKRINALKKVNKQRAQQKKVDSKTNNPKKMSDAELQKRIERLELEKKYRSLSTAQLSEGKKIAKNIVSKSAENIGTQVTTYIMGEAVNKAFQKFMKEVGKETKENIVNPRKGQKDK